MSDTKISADYSGNPFTWDGTEILPGIKTAGSPAALENGAGLASGLAAYVVSYNVQLAAIAGLTSAANKIPYFTGSGAAALLTRDTDVTLAANSDTAIATQKAVKAYIAAQGFGTGTGDVAGPASAVSHNIARFNGTTGKIIEDSGLTLAGTNTGDETAATVATLLHGVGTKTPVDADEMNLLDSAASFVAKRLTFTTLKSFLKTYFDTLYGSVFTGGTLTSALNEAPAVTIASSTTPAIFAAAGNTISMTGTTTVTGFDTIAAGAVRRVIFSGILQLTYNATSMQNLTAANITTAAGDIAEFESLGSGNTKMVSYTRLDGTALSTSGSSGTSITGTTGATGGNATATGGTSTTSANAGGQVVVLGGTPGATGIGGAVSISGAGGGATSGGGGAVTIAGGASVGSSQVGGAVSMTGGAAGSASGTSGGNATVTGGGGGNTVGGGSANLNGGAGTNSGGPVFINGGAGILSGGVTIKSGAQASGTGGTGDILIQTPNASGNSTGGNITLTAGNGPGAAAGGTVAITAGSNTSGTAFNIAGSPINMTAGAGGASNGAGGAVTFTGGAGAGTGNGGDIKFTPGAGGGSGARGNVNLNGTGAALATTATGGFTCIPTCAGTPTGTPANVPTGTVPMVFDTSGVKIWIYTGGSWKGVVVA